MEPKDLRESKVQWAQWEMMVSKALLAPRVREEGPVQWVCPDQKAPQATLVKLEKLEILDHLGRGV